MSKTKNLWWAGKRACLNAWENLGGGRGGLRLHPLWGVAVYIGTLIGVSIWSEGDSFHRLTCVAVAAGASIVAYFWMRDADFLSKRSKVWAMLIAAATPAAMVLIGALVWSAVVLEQRLEPPESMAQAWIDRCYERVGAVSRSFIIKDRVRVSCHQKAGRVGVIVIFLDGDLTQQILRKAENELGVSRLNWSRVEWELSLREFWEKAGLAPETEKNRGIDNGHTPWVGEAMSWSDKEAESFAESVFCGWVVLIVMGIPMFAAFFLGSCVVVALLRASWESQLAARKWLFQPEFRARLEMRLLNSHTKGRGKPSARSDSKRGRL